MTTDKLTTTTKLLRQRLRSVTGQLDMILSDSNPSDERRLINEGWVQALGVEQAFLTDLLARLEQQ